MRCLLIILGILLIEYSQSYKILIYAPKILRSHFNFMGHIADALVTAGHEVVFYTPAYDSSILSNGTKLARVMERRSDFETLSRQREQVFTNIWAHGLAELRCFFRMAKWLITVEDQLCESQLSDFQLINKLKGERFDVGINEALTGCGYALFMKVGIKKQVSVFSINPVEKFDEPFAIDNNPSHVPGTFGQHSDRMTFMERVENMIPSLIINIVAETIVWPRVVKHYRKNFGPNFNRTAAFAMINRSPFILANSNQLIDFPRAINHRVVYVGGIAVDQPQPLNKEFEELMESSVHGAVLVSMGSIAMSSRMPLLIKQAFISTFKAFPNITFIWKYEEDDDFGMDCKNVVKKKWVPQNDLLAHRNMKAFISHGGLNGLIESLHSGVPMIFIPLFFDQMRNAKIIEKQNGAIIIRKDNITSESIHWALKGILYDKRFVIRTKHLSQMFNQLRQTARRLVVKHVELVAQRGEIKYLELIGQTLPSYVYYFSDLLFISICFVSIIYAP